MSTDVPLLGVRQGDALGVPGSEDGVGVRFKRVDPRYFETLDIPVRDGPRHQRSRSRRRAARGRDQRGPRGPAGRAVRHARPGRERSRRLVAPAYENRGQLGKQENVEIIGVIRNERVNDLQTAVQDVVYVPLAQAPRREIKLIVRTRGRRSRRDARHPRGRAANRSAPPAGRRAHDATDPAAQPLRSSATRPGSSARSPASRRCWPRWASTASCRTP